MAGDRADYRPLRSVLHPEPDPIGLALACRDRLGLDELYLADLDAIEGREPDLALFLALGELGLSTWVDAGVRGPESLGPLIEAGVRTIVVGLETVRGPAALGEIVATVGAGAVALSLDLRDDRPILAPGANWRSDRADDLALEAIEAGVRRLILLDLARVGTGRGIGSRPLLTDLARSLPALEFVVGGGVAGPGDLEVLDKAGAAAVLVGSAIHDGRFGPGDFAC